MKNLKCLKCGNAIQKNACYVSRESYVRLQLGYPCTVVFCSEECYDSHNSIEQQP